MFLAYYLLYYQTSYDKVVDIVFIQSKVIEGNIMGLMRDLSTFQEEINSVASDLFATDIQLEISLFPELG